jgi:hypothetical protein
LRIRLLAENRLHDRIQHIARVRLAKLADRKELALHLESLVLGGVLLRDVADGDD